MHADRPGDRPRLLYWYRTAPGIALGRSPLDEDAIRTIEDQHPDIDFDWPAILALSEVMTPEDEAAPKPQQREQREQRQGRRPKREFDPARERPRDEPASASTSASARDGSSELGRDDPAETSDGAVTAEVAEPAAEATPDRDEPRSYPQSSGLVDQLAGREIASRLRGRYAEITMRIRGEDDATREALLQRADALDPDRWDTPDAVLQGVSKADALFEQLRAALAPPKP